MSTQQEPSIDEILLNALSTDKSVREPAMNLLEKSAKENFSSFLQKMGSVLSSESKDTKIRQLSAILMKNSLIHMEALQEEWRSKLKAEEKNQIKLLVLSSLASGVKEIRSAASSVIASICKTDQPIMTHWPDLIPSLTQNAFNTNLNLKLAAIETLGFVCEELTLKGIDSSNVDSILSALIQNLSNKENDVVVLTQCLKALFHTIKLAEKNFSTESEMKIIMEAIFAIVLQYHNNDDVLDKVAMLFIEMFSVSSYYDYLFLYFDKIIEFAFHMINEKYQTNERLGLLGLEIICSIGDEELSRIPSDKIVIKSSNQGLSIEQPKKPSKKYFNKIWIQLRDMIIKYVAVPEEDEDDSEWTLSKGCLYILSVMVRVVDEENVREFLKQLNIQITKDKNDIDNKCKCWLLLASCLNTYIKEVFLLFSNYFYTIVRDMDMKGDKKLQKCASFLFEKITKYYPKCIDANKLDLIFEKILPCIKSQDPNIALNACNIIQNIIKIFGDKNSNKSTNNISGFFQQIVQALFIPAMNEATNTTDNKLCLNRLMTMDVLIDYSSHDKQEAVLEILMQYLKEIESTLTNYQQLIANGSTAERIFQLQDYYYTLLRTMFKKYKTQINQNLGNKIWILTESLFKFRKTVFEEANLALGALALNMKELFTPVFPQYYPFLEFSIKSNTISSLSKSGLTALLNIIRAIGKGICPQSDTVIKTLIEVCTASDVSRYNKTIAITCLGELALMIEGDFEKYLSSVMGLLFSACEMGVNIGDDEDEDTIDFVKDLRFELIQTFTCIQFAMEEKKNILVPYVAPIYTFFKRIVADDKCQRADILKSMLSFIIDTISLFGKEIKPICEQTFASALITKLRAYNIPMYEAEINQQEEVLKILFSSN